MTNTLTGVCGRASVFVFEEHCHFIKERPSTVTILYHITLNMWQLMHFEPISCLNDLDWRYLWEANYVLYLEDIVMLLKLNAITAAIRGQISLNIRQIKCLHFEQISCSGDIYLDLVGILGMDDISIGRNIQTWSRILLTQIYKYVADITIFEGQCNDVNKDQINANIYHNRLWRNDLICVKY